MALGTDPFREPLCWPQGAIPLESQGDPQMLPSLARSLQRLGKLRDCSGSQGKGGLGEEQGSQSPPQGSPPLPRVRLRCWKQL